MAFENLDIHLGVPIRLDERAIVAKILSGRGGFCYELNGGFAWLLRGLGYEVELLAARVARKEGGFGIPFDHLTLRVTLDREYLVDVGFGDCFVEPLPLAASAALPGGRQRGYEYRLEPLGEDLLLQRRPPSGEWEPQYRFTTTPHRLADFEPGCRYHQTSPESSFTQRPICTRLDGEARVTLHRDRLTRGEETTPISSGAEWSRLLRSHFGMELPPP